MYALRPVYPPLADPLDLSDLKNYLRVDMTQDDALIRTLMRSARAWIENFLGGILVNSTFLWVSDSFYPTFTDTRGSGWDGYMSRAWAYGFGLTLAELAQLGLTPFGKPILIPRRPFLGVDSLQYVDQNGNLQTLASSAMMIDAVSDIARVLPAFGTSWPATQPVLNAVQLQFRAGWLTKFTPVATDGSSATINATRHPYNNGDNVRLSNSGGAPPGLLAVDTDYVAANVVPGVSLELQPLGGGASIKPNAPGTGTSYLGILPESIADALRLMVADLYDNRESGRPAGEILENAAKNLLWSERNFEI